MSKNLMSSVGYNPGKGQFLVYEAEDGQVKIDVRLEDETVWLTRQLMADLFQSSKQNIGQHLKNIFSEGELLENSVLKKFFTAATTNVTGLATGPSMPWSELAERTRSSLCAKPRPVKREALTAWSSG